MKLQFSILTVVLSLLISACAGKQSGSGRTSSDGRPASVNGGWTLGDKQYIFELTAGTPIQGRVKVIEGKQCRESRLTFSAHEPGWLKGGWDESQSAPCSAGNTQLVSIPKEVTELAATVSRSGIQVPQSVVMTDLPTDQKDLAPVVYGSQALLLGGSQPTGLRPVIKAGSSELKGLVVFEKILTAPTPFETIEGRVFVRPIQIDEQDQIFEGRFALAVCLDQVLTRANEEEVYAKKRAKFWSTEEHRSVLLPLLRHVLNNQLQGYKAADKESLCVR